MLSSQANSKSGSQQFDTAPSEQIGVQQGSLTILLVQDDESFAASIVQGTRRFRKSPEVIRVNRVSDAMKYMISRDIDVVLTDLELPDVTGLDTIEALNSLPFRLPLIVVSEDVSDSLAAQALQSGVQDVILKAHATAEVLEHSILNAIERHRHTSAKDSRLATLELQQQQLSTENGRLEQLVDTAHRFADNVSHEFRTPLTVIREYASLIREGMLGEVNDEQSRFLDVISSRVDDLNMMVDDMLDSSKIDAGLMGVHRVPTSLSEIVERSLSDLHLKCRIRGVEVRFEPQGTLPVVFCDPEKTARVVINLVSNAIKFCDDKSGTVRVGMDYCSETNDVVISVTDNGPGIDGEGLNQLFNRFRQLGTSTISSTKGFGLGLNIALELVELNFGTIDVQSRLGSGTTMSFTVPVDNWLDIVERYSDYLSRSHKDMDVLVIRAFTPDAAGATVAQEIDAFWRFVERQNDLIRQVGGEEWVLLLACAAGDETCPLDHIRAKHEEISRIRPRALPALEFEHIGRFTVPQDKPDLCAAACASIRMPFPR